MKHSILVYASKEKLTPQHQPLKIGDNDIVVYLRPVRIAADTKGTDQNVAPQTGEVTLGAFQLD